MKSTYFISACSLLVLLVITTICHAQPTLVGHWPLTNDANDTTGGQRHGTIENVTFDEKSGATFNGLNSRISLGNVDRLFRGDFSISVDVHTDEKLTDVVGILSYFDPELRRGFNFSIMNYAGVTNAQSNYRNVHFGISDGKET